MTHPDHVILYVDDPRRSAAFYGQILETKAVESAPTFALLVLNTGVKLGLWKREGVVPATAASGGGNEIAIAVPTDVEVKRLHADWSGRGVPILLPPTRLDFGTSFVAADPDGHRVRVMTLD